MRDVWAANIERYRAMSAKSQADARKAMQANGVTFVDPSAEQVAADRKRMIAAQADLDPRHQAVGRHRQARERRRRRPQLNRDGRGEFAVARYVVGQGRAASDRPVRPRRDDRRPRAGRRALCRPALRHLLGRGGDRLSRRLGHHARGLATGAHRRPCAARSRAARRVRRASSAGWRSLNCLVALAFCAGLAWYGWSIVETSWHAGRAQFIGLCSFRCGSIRRRCRPAPR